MGILCEYYCNDCGKKFFHSSDYHIICPHCLGMDTETRISREGEI